MRLFTMEDPIGSGSAAAPQIDLTIFEKPISERFPIMGTEFIDLTALKLDAGTQFRPHVKPETVARYAEVVQADMEAKRKISLPPITVFRDPVSNENVVADGFQRVDAHKAVKGVKSIEAEIRIGTERDAVLYAAGANHAHGEPRDAKTIHNSIVALANDPVYGKLSYRVIAGIVHCSEGTVRNHWPAAAARSAVITKSGKTIATDAIGKPEAAAKKAAAKTAAKTAKKDAKKSAANAQTATTNAKATPQSSKAPTPKKAPEKTAKEILAKEIASLEKGIGGKEGKGVAKGIIEGTLRLSVKEVQAWAGMTPRNQGWIAPLVVEKGFKPQAALEFLQGEVSPKLLGELVLRAMAGKGKSTINQIVEDHGLRVTIELVKKR